METGTSHYLDCIAKIKQSQEAREKITLWKHVLLNAGVAVRLREGYSSQNSTSLPDLDICFLDSSKNTYISLFSSYKSKFQSPRACTSVYYVHVYFCWKDGMEKRVFWTLSELLHVLTPFSSDTSLQVTGLIPWAATAVRRPRCCMWSFILLPEKSLKSFKKQSKGLWFYKETTQEAYPQQT